MGEQVSITGLGQVSVTVADVDRAVAFYRDVLGLPHLYTFGQLGFMQCGETRLFLDALPEACHQGTSVLYFSVAEIDRAVEGLEANGVAFDGAPHMIHRHEDGTEEWMAFFRDPDGNMLALMSRVEPTGGRRAVCGARPDARRCAPDGWHSVQPFGFAAVSS